MELCCEEMWGLKVIEATGGLMTAQKDSVQLDS
jgi:hypothetical protein